MSLSYCQKDDWHEIIILCNLVYIAYCTLSTIFVTYKLVLTLNQLGVLPYRLCSRCLLVQKCRCKLFVLLFYCTVSQLLIYVIPFVRN